MVTEIGQIQAVVDANVCNSANRFYETQSDGLGTIFLTRFILTLIHWPILRACTVLYWATIGCFQNVSHLLFITVSPMIRLWFMQYLIAAGIRAGLG